MSTASSSGMSPCFPRAAQYCTNHRSFINTTSWWYWPHGVNWWKMIRLAEILHEGENKVAFFFPCGYLNKVSETPSCIGLFFSQWPGIHKLGCKVSLILLDYGSVGVMQLLYSFVMYTSCNSSWVTSRYYIDPGPFIKIIQMNLIWRKKLAFWVNK